MNSLTRLQENWEGFAQVDPLWAICVDSQRRGNQWTKKEFFETGKTEIGRVMTYLRSLGLFSDMGSPALDFGCGVGRLTRALAQYFPECWGVDISPTMIRLAEEFNQDCAQCHFWLNAKDDLHRFPDEHFGFIYSSIVLQHIQRKYVVRYLVELIRVLKAGGIFVFQAPEREKSSLVYQLRNKVGFRRRITRLRGQKSLDAFHMKMHCITEREIRELLSRQPVRIVDVKLTNSSTGKFNGNLEFLDREPDRGFVSKQYCLVKTRQRATATTGDQQKAKQRAGG
ncbi:MAG TPA: class I SAM-dependent methyltransferase [Candidatus Angelobacter sp.]